MTDLAQLLSALLLALQTGGSAPEARQDLLPLDMAVCAVVASALHERLSADPSFDAATLEVLAGVRDESSRRLAAQMNESELQAVFQDQVPQRLESLWDDAALNAVGDCAVVFGLARED